MEKWRNIYIPFQPEETFSSSLLIFCNFSSSEGLKVRALLRGGGLTVTNFLGVIISSVKNAYGSDRTYFDISRHITLDRLERHRKEVCLPLARYIHDGSISFLSSFLSFFF